MGNGAQRIPSWPGASAPTKAEYICADQPVTLTFRLRKGGGPYIPDGPQTARNLERRLCQGWKRGNAFGGLLSKKLHINSYMQIGIQDFADIVLPSSAN